MTIELLMISIVGIGIILGGVAWASPKVIRAMYPEDQHERMIKMQGIMIIIVLIVAVIGLISGSFAYFANSA